MGIFGRFLTGLRLAKGSLAVLFDHPRLLLFPLVGGLAGLVYVGALLGGTFGLLQPEREVVVYGALFLVYAGSTFVASFFTAGLMHATRDAFRGEAPSVRRSLGAAWGNVGTLLLWSLLAAVVGVVIRAIEESSDIGGKIVALLFSVAWAVVTYFVVPAIVFEDVSVRGAFSRSGSLVRSIWGESLGAETGVSIVSFLLTALGVLVAVALFVALPTDTTAGLAAVAVGGGTAILLALLVGYALTGVAKTALYVYGTEGETPRYFSGVDFGNEGR
ncbi:DUF6159 family protein [Salinirussus salinus]|jgi:hypothetical protein|uniref:DUF6159 family protein n=1 Tax=Salinirussus salinus TaxID=1198300 RepID=UPI0013582215|nr:DUF6159 family protein [Salinirussus salinus]